MILSDFVEIFGIKKLESLGNVAHVILCITVFIQIWHKTDKQTDDNSIYHVSIMLHGKNICAAIKT